MSERFDLCYFFLEFGQLAGLDARLLTMKEHTSKLSGKDGRFREPDVLRLAARLSFPEMAASKNLAVEGDGGTYGCCCCKVGILGLEGNRPRWLVAACKHACMSRERGLEKKEQMDGNEEKMNGFAEDMDKTGPVRRENNVNWKRCHSYS